MYEHAIALIREFGFPVFVAVWFMWRLEKKIDRLFELMGALMGSTALLAKSVDHYHEIARLTGGHEGPPARDES